VSLVAQGVDAMARADIHALVHAHVDRGNAALVVSSDLEELRPPNCSQAR
jgi:ABC-type sugar transport system ATPase subunit